MVIVRKPTEILENNIERRKPFKIMENLLFHVLPTSPKSCNSMSMSACP